MMERKVFKCLMSGSAPTRLLLMSPHVDNRPPNVIHRCLLEMLMHVIFMARSSAVPKWLWCISVLFATSQWNLIQRFSLPAGSLGDF